MGAKMCAILLNYLGLMFYRTDSEVSSGQGPAVITEQCLIFRAGKIVQGISAAGHILLIVFLLKCITGLAHSCPYFKKKNVTVPLVDPTAS